MPGPLSKTSPADSIAPLRSLTRISHALDLVAIERSEEIAGGLFLEDGEDFELRFGGLAAGSCQVVRLGAQSIWFASEAADALPLDLPVEAWLARQDGMQVDIGPLPGEVAARPGSPMLELQIDKHALAIDAARALLMLIDDISRRRGSSPRPRPDSLREVIDRPERIQPLLSLLATRSEGHAHMPDQRAFERVRIVALDFDRDEVHWEGREGWPARHSSVDFEGYNSVYRVAVPPGRAQGGAWITPVPRTVERIRHRQFRRGHAAELTLRFDHPDWPLPAAIARPVSDVSLHGLRFRSRAREDLVYAGLEIPLAEVTTRSGTIIRARCEVRSITPEMDGMSTCGATVVPLSPIDERLWGGLVDDSLYPGVGGAADGDALWDLFDASGYLRLSGKDPSRFGDLKRSFSKAARRAAGVPQLFCQAVVPSARGIEAAVSMLKAYRGTWFGHQLAKRPGTPPDGADPRQILRDIYFRAHEHPQHDPGFRWMLGFIEAKVPWMKRAHVDFAAKHATSGLALGLPFRLLEIACDGPDAPSSFEIGPARANELGALSRALWASRPRPYLEALDLVPERVRLTEIAESWRAAGFERAREIHVARERGTAIAAAVMEIGQVGTSLFRLLDGMRLFALEEGGERAFPALAMNARRWFAQHRRTAFVYFCEEDSAVDRHAPIDALDLGEGYLWVIAAELLPDFLEHVYEMTAPRRPVSGARASDVPPPAIIPSNER